MERYYLIFKGNVQGVGFRYFVLMLVQKHELTGWIRNMYNGNVEMEIQGNHDTIFNIIAKIKHGNGWSTVNDYAIKQIPIKNESKFIIKY